MIRNVPEDPLPARDPYAAFRVPNFFRYILGNILIQIGMGAQGLAIGWDIYKRTGQPLALGLVGGVQAIPMILLSLPAGYLADKFDRRRIITICLLGVALCSLGLSWLSHINGSIQIMYLLLLLDATFMTLQRPAGASIFPSLVPPETFENAMKWNSSMSQISAVGGPALGAAIIVWSIPAAYVTNAVFAVVFISLLLSLSLKPSPAAAGTMSLSNVLAGVRFVWSRKVLLASISLDLFAVLLGGATYLLPVFAQDILHVGAHGLGWLRAAPAVGAFIMAILLAHLPPLRHAGRTLLFAVAGFGVATIIFGISKNFWLSWVMLLLTGALDNVSVVVRHTLIQLLTPDEMRGRVSAVNAIFIGSSNEIGGLESGVVAQALTPVASVIIGGIGTIAVVTIWALTFPRLRRFGRLTVTPEELAADEENVSPIPVS
ncbi:MAG TPA: MFS transporter [Armatimonadota bacterium]|nr:MFS transporter [Armatimonadota bacterium]